MAVSGVIPKKVILHPTTVVAEMCLIGPKVRAGRYTKFNEFCYVRNQAVLMRSTTLHRTSVRPWHKNARISLDLRFML